MLKMLGYLKTEKLSVFLIAAFLVLQAFCDLSLPSYTSDIVDVGIQQGGIEDAALIQVSETSMEKLQLFMTEEETQLVNENYELKEDGSYYLKEVDQETQAAISEAFTVPMVILTYLDNTEMTSDTVLTMYETGLMTSDQLMEIREQAMEQMEGYSDSLLEQQAITYVEAEYESLGMDMGQLQTDYLIDKGIRMTLMAIVMMGCAVMVGFLASRAAARVGMLLRQGIFKKVVAFSNTEIDKFSTASLITRSTNDIQQVQMVTVLFLRMLLYAPILGVGGIIKVATTRTGMGWIIGVAVGVILFVVVILMYLAMPKFKIMQSLVDRLNLVSREILTGIFVIRAFGRERFEEKRFEGANKELMDTQLFTNRVMTFMMPVMMFVMNGVTVLIVWVGAHGIDTGTLQVGDMMAFITYTMQIVMSFLFLAMLSIMLPRAGVAAGRINEVLHTEILIRDSKSVKDDQIENIRGELVFENVCFRYPNAKEDALANINFSAVPGETTAIIGSTGSGKSTLIQLIPRLYDIRSGKIALDGVDIRELSQKKLRSAIGYVPQKGILFSGDIASNIKFGGSDISDEMMENAADIAQAKEFIEAKNEHYESPIAQGGNNVSGGQKQRLSIARAIAKDPKIYLFDDSFSALDYKTDVTLRKALKERTSDATVIIVAQRISTVLHADKILVLEEGKIVGMGSHDELMETCDAYREIAKSQLSEEELKGGIA